MGDDLRTERELSLDFLRVTEAAAIAAARTMGQGDRKGSDAVAVEAMREVMDSVPMRGRVVIGEGERDEARAAFRTAAKHLQVTLGPDHPETRRVLALAETERTHQ